MSDVVVTGVEKALSCKARVLVSAIAQDVGAAVKMQDNLASVTR
jgi:hypothetical protein